MKLSDFIDNLQATYDRWGDVEVRCITSMYEGEEETDVWGESRLDKGAGGEWCLTIGEFGRDPLDPRWDTGWDG